MVTFLFYFTFTGQKYSVTLWTRIINFILPPNWERELLMSRNIKKKPIHWTCSTYLVLSSVTKKKKKKPLCTHPKEHRGLRVGGTQITSPPRSPKPITEAIPSVPHRKPGGITASRGVQITPGRHKYQPKPPKPQSLNLGDLGGHPSPQVHGRSYLGHPIAWDRSQLRGMGHCEVQGKGILGLCKT